MSDSKGPGHRLGRLHRRLRRRGAAPPRPRGRRHRQLLQVRPGQQVLRRPPQLRLRRGRRPRHRPDDEAARRLRPLHRRRGADRRHLLLPRLRLRPARHQRADHGARVRRRDRGPPRRQAAEGHLPLAARWSSSRPSTGPPRRATSGRSRRRCRPTASRSSPWSTSPRPPGTSTSCPYTIVRPFNCVGIGEGRALGDVEVDSRQRQAGHEPRRPRPRPEGRQGPGPAAHPGRGQPDPALHLRRRPGDRHRRVHGATRPPTTRTSTSPPPSRPPCSSSPRSSGRKIKGDAPLTLVSDPAFEYDVQKRVPDVEKAKDVLGFECTTTLDDDARRGHPVGHPGRRTTGSSDPDD